MNTVAGRRSPVAIIVAVVLSALVAGGALVVANQVRDRPVAAPTTTAAPTPSVGPDGCLVRPCKVLATTPVAGTTVELIADRGARSGRLRIGGPSARDVIDVTVTELGVKLTPRSLQCVAGTLSACLIRGPYDRGTAGQVVVGRSGKWNSLAKPYVSDAGYLALAEVTADVGPEVVAVQHDCSAGSDCAEAPVFAQVFTMGGREAGCTQDFGSVESLPTEIRSGDLADCD
ncbi:hypothetical protein [Actinophytocola sp.]|uniref:hypothetical protein n=1 Tax=Actinophytocola sp. TaxID=1872138 RepID=UPI003D6A6518